ncbi:site-specific DNA-methyltransferase [Deinococcus budaensis]|uniref:Adenine specific DNA methylase Mod n=1 Tax=Deinococcus budaensis TaxID=1665626 RepID=A0A7W8LR97_9DEIO|nr:site-specific DNA-methyltransferase [Deinococcus budaensis]MBB5235594.1 adenine specific DNA methylase Mod [Deinococcus budaensis]
MQRLTADRPETQSLDGITQNLTRLQDLFPEAFTEGRLDFDVLRGLLGDQIDDRPEKYGLSWNGKARARRHALTPTRATLRPDRECSVDWDGTGNLMIEGDNLEVLKLLQRSYAGKVKLIYIDPPYNTGKDFVYPDDYTDSLRNYRELTGQLEEGRRVSSNTESSGRFHTDWLNMMYPRLKLARELLRDDGAILISIGDEEVGNTRAVLDEVFGQENLSGIMVITRSEGGGLASQMIKGHDYLFVYAKNISSFRPLRRPKDIRGEIVEVEGKTYWIEEDWLRREFGKYGTCEYDEIIHYHGDRKKKEIDDGIHEGIYRLINKKDGRIIVGRLRDVEQDSSKLYSIQKHLNSKASDDLEPLEMGVAFSYPKPTSLIKEVVLGGSFFSSLGVKSQGEV